MMRTLVDRARDGAKLALDFRARMDIEEREPGEQEPPPQWRGLRLIGKINHCQPERAQRGMPPARRRRRSAE